MTNCGLDYDFVDFRSLKEASIIDKSLSIADEKYKIIVLADIKALHASSLEKILEFYRCGGIVLATGNLPQATSKKGENDPEPHRIIKELFGITANTMQENIPYEKQTNPAGGVGWYIPNAIEKYIPELITPDFLPQKRIGKVLHRKIGERDVYMVTDVEKDTECFFRSKRKVELWDARTGTTEPYPVIRQTDQGTWLSMHKDPSNSYLIVFSPGEPIIQDTENSVLTPSYQIQLGGEWKVELLPTLNNKWGDYRFPAFDGMIAAEARSFKYAPALTSANDWTKAQFDDSLWKEEFYGYGPQVETKTDHTDWEPISFSWQYGVWNNPGSQGYHGLKGKIEDRFFILDKGENQQFKSYVFAPRSGNYRIHIEGSTPQQILVNKKEVKNNVYLEEGWHSFEVTYPDSEKMNYRLRTGLLFDGRKRSMVIFYPDSIQVPDKPTLYADKISSRWGDKKQLLFDPYGGKYNVWNFRFESAPGLEEMDITVYGDALKVWVDGEEVNQENIRITESREMWNKYVVKLPYKKERIAQVAFSVQSQKGYQGTAVIKEPVLLKTSTGLLHAGDWSKEGALRFYSGGMYYRKAFTLPSGIKAKQIILDLGDIIATCEVKINGQPAGIFINPPYQLNMTPYISEGKNDIEVLVYSTLSNHYQTIPTPYKGDPKAGLIGPVQILFY